MSDSTHGDRIDQIEERLDKWEAILLKKFGAAAIHPEDEHRLEMAQAAENATNPAAARLDADQPRLAGTEVGADRIAREKDWESHRQAKKEALAGVTAVHEGIVTGQAVGVKPDTSDSGTDGKTVEELRSEAAELDIHGRSSMTKDELVRAISDARGSGTASTTTTTTTA